MQLTIERGPLYTDYSVHTRNALKRVAHTESTHRQIPRIEIHRSEKAVGVLSTRAFQRWYMLREIAHRQGGTAIGRKDVNSLGTTVVQRSGLLEIGHSDLPIGGPLLYLAATASNFFKGDRADERTNELDPGTSVRSIESFGLELYQGNNPKDAIQVTSYSTPEHRHWARDLVAIRAYEQEGDASHFRPYAALDLHKLIGFHDQLSYVEDKLLSHYWPEKYGPHALA